VEKTNSGLFKKRLQRLGFFDFFGFLLNGYERHLFFSKSIIAKKTSLGVLNYMKRRVFFLVGLLAAVAAVNADGIYKVVEHNIPEVVRPGQQVVGKLKVEVVSQGDPVYDRPFVTVTSGVDPQRKLEAPELRMAPWYLTKDQKPGDILWVGFVMDVPMDFPAGPAELDLTLFRKLSEEKWENAMIQDGTGKAKDGIHYKVPIKVDNADVGDVDLPLVVKRMAKPTLDGKVDPEEWKSAGVIEAFAGNRGGEVKAGTKAYVGYDEKNIYVAFVCDEPLMAKTGRVQFPGRDREIYNPNETVYLFFNPQADRTSYMQFIVDILNQQYDALGADPVGFNPPWQNKVWEGESSWSVEVAIPFGSLTASTPEPGQKWCGDFFRLRQVGVEMTAWKPTGGGFDSPGAFGTLVFDSIQKHLENEVKNLDTAKTEFPKELAGEGGKWRKGIETLQRRVSALTEDEAAMAYASLVGEIESLRKEGVRLQRKTMQLSGKGLVVFQSQPYTLFVGKPMTDDEPAGPVQVTMLQDEWVDLTWNMTNVTDETITVRCLTLDGKDAKGVDFLRMTLSNMEASWCQAMPAATGDKRKMWDVISPIPTGVVQIAPGQTVQVWLTLHAPADAEAGGQDLRAVIRPIDVSEIETVIIPLSVRVLSHKITAKRYINIFTWNLLHPEVNENQAWFDAHLDNLVAHGVNVYMLHNTHMFPRPKANPDGTLAEPMDFAKLDRMIEASRGKFDMYYLTLDIWEKDWVQKDLFGLDIKDPSYEKAFKIWFAAILEHLKSKGITNDNLIVNPYDESTNENCQQIARWMKEVDPKCRIVIDWSPADMDEAKKMDALTDVWVPHHRHFFQEELKPFHQMVRDSKKPYWCYFYSEGGNEKAQDPTLHYMAKFWWCYQNKLVGIGYWANQYYGNPWYRKASPGYYDTSMVYPIQGGVVSSRRWQAWRRGWQDYNLLSILRDKLEKDGNQVDLKKLDDYVRDVVAFPADQAKRQSVRDWIKAKI
jgi:hypothetical protein